MDGWMDMRWGTERTRIGQAASRRRDEHLWDTRRSRRLAYVRTNLHHAAPGKRRRREKPAKQAKASKHRQSQSKANKGLEAAGIHPSRPEEEDLKPVQLPFAAQLPPEAHRAHRKEEREWSLIGCWQFLWGRNEDIIGGDGRNRLLRPLTCR
ncbi:hypothetical protein DTO212C5_837 [Paecilomyces variotii]|nr:hypothetical protein DTO212C5_837 [Paecilomyces variotii]